MKEYRADCTCGWSRRRCPLRSIASDALRLHAPRNEPNDRHWQAFRGAVSDEIPDVSIAATAAAGIDSA